MRSWSLAATVLLGSSFFQQAAAGDALYKCIDSQGAISIQDKPCAGPTQTQSVTPVEVDPHSRAQQGRLYQADPADRSAPRRTRRTTRLSQCEQVRAKVAKERDREGLTASFDRRSQWDERVRRACR